MNNGLVPDRIPQCGQCIPPTDNADDGDGVEACEEQASEAQYKPDRTQNVLLIHHGGPIVAQIFTCFGNLLLLMLMLMLMLILLLLLLLMRCVAMISSIM
jgi:predicted RND superfamily exporter protein